MKRYVIHPGQVQSKNDGQRHFIGFSQLCSLYRVNPADCFNASEAPTAMRDEWPDHLIHLWPSYNGNYEIPR